MNNTRERWWRRPFRRPKRALLVVALVALTGFGLSSAFATIVWPQYNFHQAKKALQRYDVEAARRSLEVCVEAWPASVEVRLLAARAHRLAERYDEAEKHLNFAQKLLQGQPDDAWQLERDLVQAQRGQLEAVEKQLTRLVQEEHPDRLLILGALGEGYRKSFRLGDAYHCYTVWLELQPDALPALRKRAWLLDRLDQAERAVADYQRILELDPGDEESQRALAQVLLDLGNLEGAVALLEPLRGRHPEDAQLGWAMAHCFRNLGKSEQALAMLDAVIAQDPNHQRAILERGHMALEADQLDDAERWLRRAVQLDPVDYKAHYQLSQCLQRRGKVEEARTHEARANQLYAEYDRFVLLRNQVVNNPRDADLLSDLGRLFLGLGQEADAMQCFQCALRERPKHVATHQSLAEFFERKGNPQQAQYHRQQAVLNAASAPQRTPPPSP